MDKRLTRYISLFVAFFLLGSVMFGCGKASEETTAPTTPAVQQTLTPEPTKAAAYPIQTDVTLTYWMELHPNATSSAKNFGELPIAKELEEKTGVKVEYIHPATGQARDVFNIMIASGDYPDIIEYNWTEQYPGGPAKAVNDGVIVELTDLFPQYCPNITAYFNAHPDINKQVKSDDGKYYLFPFIRGGKELLTSSGPIIRKDWLDELNLPVPETIDEWYAVLKEFRDKKGATAPFTTNTDGKKFSFIKEIFAGAFGIRVDFYQDNGKVKYGPYEPGYKDYLKTMAQWYDEGLLDKNFATTEKQAMDSNMMTGKSGATYGAGGGALGTYMNTMASKDPAYKLTAAKFPVLNKGDKAKYGFISTEYAVSNGHAAITKTSKNIELAARYLDYAYGEEGSLVYNYGAEGESYTIVDGKPTYTELVSKNPDKLSFAQAVTKYARGATNGPFVQDPGYIMQFYALPEQKEALTTYWTDQEFNKTILPMVSYTPAESEELAKIRTDLETFYNEYSLKVILGNESVDSFDQYLEQMKTLKVERAIEIVQAALDRYVKR